jgi:hypothetical protein
MWLPPRLARPCLWDNSAGKEVLEPVDVWQTRVALELAAAGLFDPEKGWVDVLAEMAGINIDNEADYRRVESWMNGTIADPELDEVGPRFTQRYLPEDTDDPQWAVDEATVLTIIPVHEGDPRGPLVLLGVGGAAHHLLSIIDAFSAGVDGIDASDVASVLELGVCLPLQTTSQLSQWEDLSTRFNEADNEPWAVGVIVNAIRPLLTPLVDQARAVHPILAERFNLGGVVPRHAASGEPSQESGPGRRVAPDST